MPIENAKRFLKDVQSDEALAEQADDAYVSALLAVASKAGYEVSDRDLRAALDAGASRELGDGDLEQVAGGAFNTAGGVFNTANYGGFFNSFSKKGFLG